MIDFFDQSIAEMQRHIPCRRRCQPFRRAACKLQTSPVNHPTSYQILVGEVIAGTLFPAEEAMAKAVLENTVTQHNGVGNCLSDSLKFLVKQV